MNSIDLADIPTRYRRLIGPTGRRFEPVLTEWIVAICATDARFKVSFANALGNLLNLKWPVDARLLHIDGQHRSERARFDIAVRDQRGMCVAVVEAKVDDPVDPFKLQFYRDVPEIRESRSAVISLARDGAHDRLTNSGDLAAAGFKFLTWDMLLSRLESDQENFSDAEIPLFFNFCRALSLDKKNGIGRARGPALTELNLLNRIREELTEWDTGPVERPVGIAARIRIGRPAWKHTFGDHTYKRLLVYYDRRAKTGPPNLHFQLMLFNAKELFGSKPECETVLPAWLESVRRVGLGHYCPMKGYRANTEAAKLRTSDVAAILRREYFVTDDIRGLTRVEDVCPQTFRIWIPQLLHALNFYDQLVGGFSRASFG